VAGCCECGVEPSGSGTTELVNINHDVFLLHVVIIKFRSSSSF
jgi:hypothetical protein